MNESVRNHLRDGQVDESTRQYDLLWNHVRDGRADEARKLLDIGLDVNHDYGQESTLLTLAINRSHNGRGDINQTNERLEIVSMIIEKGANLGPHGKWKRTALHQAASKGFHEMTSMLLDKECDAYAVNIFGESVLDRANCIFGNKETIVVITEAITCRKYPTKRQRKDNEDPENIPTGLEQIQSSGK